jgi:hypothetical protein
MLVIMVIMVIIVSQIGNAKEFRLFEKSVRSKQSISDAGKRPVVPSAVRWASGLCDAETGRLASGDHGGGASVHPREVVKQALQHNAAAVVLAHNHPSGVAEPSQADELITGRLREALQLVDIRVLDHLIVAGGEVVSFAEHGLL